MDATCSRTRTVTFFESASDAGTGLVSRPPWPLLLLSCLRRDSSCVSRPGQRQDGHPMGRSGVNKGCSTAGIRMWDRRGVPSSPTTVLAELSDECLLRSRRVHPLPDWTHDGDMLCHSCTIGLNHGHSGCCTSTRLVEPPSRSFGST